MDVLDICVEYKIHSCGANSKPDSSERNPDTWPKNIQNQYSKFYKCNFSFCLCKVVARRWEHVGLNITLFALEEKNKHLGRPKTCYVDQMQQQVKENQCLSMKSHMDVLLFFYSHLPPIMWTSLLNTNWNYYPLVKQ